MASKKVLLTGFEPFGGASFNPSGAVVQEIAEHGIDGIEIVTAILPVEYKRSAEILINLIEIHQPSVVISLGQAEGRDFIGPEQVAINLANARIADNAGVKLENQPINTLAADGYFSTQLNRALRKTQQANDPFLVVIGHPKALTQFGFKTLESFIAQHHRNHEFVTLSSVL